MDLVKIYLIQSITTAANNLRLSAQQVEVVGLLRETIMNSGNVGSEFLRMKKSTELSKLAIRLSEIHAFLTQGKVDFLKISEQFKEHSRYLIRDLSQFLENVNPKVYKDAFNKINNGSTKEINVELIDRSNLAGEILVNQYDDSGELRNEKDFENINQISIDFERKILEPIKPLDELLKRMSTGNMDKKQLIEYSELIDDNALLSSQRGLNEIAKMHKIVASAFNEILNGNLVVDKSVSESLRACLIVIVANIKKKEVDIREYLKRVEEFTKKYLTQSIQV